MKKLLLVPSLMMLLAACGTATVEESTHADPGLRTSENALIRCNLGCSAGEYVAGYQCDSSCGTTCPGPNNATSCSPVPTGSNYVACGYTTTPPPNYYIYNYDHTNGCDAIQVTTELNRTFYAVVPSTDSTFDSCGIDSCPSGTYAVGYSNYSGCGVSADKNRTHCNKWATTTNFAVCGIGCPAGATAYGYQYSSGCKKSINDAATTNQTFCRR